MKYAKTQDGTAKPNTESPKDLLPAMSESNSTVPEEPTTMATEPTAPDFKPAEVPTVTEEAHPETTTAAEATAADATFTEDSAENSPADAEDKSEDIVAEISIDGENADEDSPQSLDTLVSLVLDAAEVANRSAMLASGATEQMVQTVDDLRHSVHQSKINAFTVLGAGALISVVAIVVLFFTSSEVKNRIEHADSMMLAVGRRVVDMNIKLDQQKKQAAIPHTPPPPPAPAPIFDPKPITDGLQKLENKIGTISTDVSSKVSAEIKTLKENDLANQKLLLNQIKALEAQTQAQAKTIAKLSEQVAATQNTAPKIAQLTKNVETLMAQEKARPVMIAPAPTPAPTPAPAPKPAAKPAEKPPTEFIQYPLPSPGR